MSLTVSASGITFNDLTTLSTGRISAVNIAVGSIGTLQLSANAVTTDKIALGAVITEDIANGAVTAAKLNGGQSGSAPIYGCRAWVNFDSTRNASGGSDTLNTNRFIRSSGNVSSVLRNATGDYTITFTTPMSDANYTVCSNGSAGAVVSQIVSTYLNTATAPSTTQVRIGTTGGNTGSATDYSNVSVQVFGN